MSVTPDIVSAPSASAYGFRCVLPKQDFAQTIVKVTDALKTEGSVAVLQMTTNPEVARVAHEVRERLDRVRPRWSTAPRS